MITKQVISVVPAVNEKDGYTCNEQRSIVKSDSYKEYKFEISGNTRGGIGV